MYRRCARDSPPVLRIGGLSDARQAAQGTGRTPPRGPQRCCIGRTPPLHRGWRCSDRRCTPATRGPAMTAQLDRVAPPVTLPITESQKGLLVVDNLVSTRQVYNQIV